MKECFKCGAFGPFFISEDFMTKRVWRPLNTVGLVIIGAVVAFVITYNIMELSRVCSAL
jgi:hypothetical protein